MISMCRTESQTFRIQQKFIRAKVRTQYKDKVQLTLINREDQFFQNDRQFIKGTRLVKSLCACWDENS